MLDIELNPQFIKAGRNRKLVVLTEEEYDRLLDVIDNYLAKQIEEDKSTEWVKWDDVKDKILPNGSKCSQNKKSKILKKAAGR